MQLAQFHWAAQDQMLNEHSNANIHKYTDTAHYLTKEEKQKEGTKCNQNKAYIPPKLKPQFT